MAVQARHGPQFIEAKEVNAGFKVNHLAGRSSEAVLVQSKRLPNNPHAGDA